MISPQLRGFRGFRHFIGKLSFDVFMFPRGTFTKNCLNPLNKKREVLSIMLIFKAFKGFCIKTTKNNPLNPLYGGYKITGGDDMDSITEAGALILGLVFGAMAGWIGHLAGMI